MDREALEQCDQGDRVAIILTILTSGPTGLLESDLLGLEFWGAAVSALTTFGVGVRVAGIQFRFQDVLLAGAMLLAGAFVTVRALNERARAIAVVFVMATLLVTLLLFLCLGPVEMVRGEVAARCLQDVFCWEGFVNWVVRVYLVVALGKHVSDAGVESNEECCIVVVQGDLAIMEEGSGGEAEIPVVCHNISFVANSVLS